MGTGSHYRLPGEAFWDGRFARRAKQCSPIPVTTSGGNWQANDLQTARSACKERYGVRSHTVLLIPFSLCGGRAGVMLVFVQGYPSTARLRPGCQRLCVGCGSLCAGPARETLKMVCGAVSGTKGTAAKLRYVHGIAPTTRRPICHLDAEQVFERVKSYMPSLESPARVASACSTRFLSELFGLCRGVGLGSVDSTAR